MVNKFKKILEKIAQEEENIVLFALLSMEGFSESWTVIFSTKGVNKSNSKSTFEYLLKQMKINLDEQELSKVTRIGIFDEHDHITQLFQDYKSGMTLENIQLNGLNIKLGYIIYSNFSNSEIV